MIDLEQVKKRVEEFQSNHNAAMDRLNMGHIDSCPTCRFVTIARGLIEEAERLHQNDDNLLLLRKAEEVSVLQREKAELKSKLEAQQKVIDAFGSNVEGVHSLVTEIIEQRSLKLQVAELESKLCGMRELYELHQSNRPDLPFAVRAKIVFRMEEIFQQALSSTPECKHKEELMRRIGEETALECDGAKAVGKQLASLQAELQEAKKWRFDDTTVASLREELKAVREENEQLQATDKETKK